MEVILYCFYWTSRLESTDLNQSTLFCVNLSKNKFVLGIKLSQCKRGGR